MHRYIAVLDVGKTNKKIFIFNEQLAIVESSYQQFSEFEKDAINFEPVEEISAWLIAELTRFSQKYAIQAISVTTHGATALCLDKQGKLAVPAVAYTTSTDTLFREEFYREFGTPIELQKTTATAEVGSLINVAKVLYFIKKKYPTGFSQIDAVVNYPQYFGYILTGKLGAEPTYTGCHSYLYDFIHKEYSSVARKLGIAGKMLFPLKKSWEVLGTISPAVAKTTGLAADCVVTMGIHDSNSSLLPYLVKGHHNFVLNSTGTWCVAMSPAQSVEFKENELGKLVFFNLDAFNNPVKTSIFMGGLEYETYTKLLFEINKREPSFAIDVKRVQKVIDEKTLFIIPSVARGTGIFPDSAPRVVEHGVVYSLEEIQQGKRIPDFFKDPETALIVLAISLALQTKAAFEMVGFRGNGTVFTEGGFRKNNLYNELLAALLPQAKIALTDLQEATAFGAAMLGKAALDHTTPLACKDLFEIEEKQVTALPVTGFAEYENAFLRYVNK